MQRTHHSPAASDRRTFLRESARGAGGAAASLFFAHSTAPAAPSADSPVAATKGEPYTLPRRRTMVFDVPPHLEDDPRGAERRLFSKVPYVQPGT